MAVVDHIRIASAELRKAAELVKQEIDDLRTDEAQSKRDIDSQIADLAQRMRMLETDLRRSDNSNQRAQLQQAIAGTGLQIARLRSKETAMIRDMENAIRAKRGQVNRLESQSRSLAP